MARPPHAARGDIGRRVAARRLQLGLSREDVALRAGAAPGYIEYVEEQSATPGISFLLRLADALETTVHELTGGTVDLPGGLGRAAREARMVELGDTECWTLLGDHGVGRVALTHDDGPVVLPVNYQVLDGEVMFSTGDRSPLARAADTEIAFETDHIDDAFSKGWSVLLVGTVRVVEDEDEARRLRETAYSTPWAGEGRERVMVLAPRRVTGRRIIVADAPGEPG
ncbi:helix-turn-helix domain-containing protein [Streptomyces microflavus]|uniref:Helix-turn-helix domain protein n=1 Tax=Streptomyces microflavus DSM 40593 TaxID=1303692 RepID=N0CIB5_STRMI|nr:MULTISPECIES: pyridoxamine 5'-phosphate oxidase family protein [Streptomyces]AGK75410.1 Helix-turn-helix domain protein [Streptomyces microflavus DSM 40593]WSA59028.1 pyridoxamine 5'-phosphate oxidase family protein [Streptomyces microflavus]SCK34748.1 Predicted flavin-nucleotide-binding protein [Streptomyces sp. ScaeMP-e48]